MRRDHKTCRLVHSFVCTAVVVFCSAPAPAQVWELVWADEFNGAALDTSKWQAMTGDGTAYGLPAGWGNNELQWYRPENAFLENGHLVIEARRESFSGRNYTSARLRTMNLGDWAYGRFEMRAKLPTGKGLWPAFWLLPTQNSYGGWAASGEIDIMELVGHQPDIVHGTLHYGGAWPNNVFSGASYQLGSGSFADDLHVFALEWEPDEMRWYVDGKLYQTQRVWWSAGAPYPAPFDRRFHLLLNVAVGGNWPGSPDASTVFPQRLVADYVRVYRDKNEPPSVVVTSPAANATLDPGTPLTLAADAGDTDGSVRFVTFYQDGAVIGADSTAPYTLNLTEAQPGCYIVRAAATDDQGRTALSPPVAFTLGSCQPAPYLIAPAAIPGAIEAENFDLGGEGVAYHDAGPAMNSGNAFGNNFRRSEGVDIQLTADSGGGYNVGWIERNEWLQYTVRVARSGVYTLEARIASEQSTGAFYLEFDGANKTGTIAVPRTGGWQTWRTVRRANVALEAGVHSMRLVAAAPGFNLNRLVFTRLATSAPEPNEGPPEGYALLPNFPNPFNPVTTIRYRLPRPDFVTLAVFNAGGRLVSTLVERRMPPGEYALQFDGSALSSGVYVLAMSAGSFAGKAKMLLLK